MSTETELEFLKRHRALLKQDNDIAMQEFDDRIADLLIEAVNQHDTLQDKADLLDDFLKECENGDNYDNTDTWRYNIERQYKTLLAKAKALK